MKSRLKATVRYSSSYPPNTFRSSGVNFGGGWISNITGNEVSKCLYSTIGKSLAIRMTTHKIIMGDAIEEMKKLKPNSVDLIFADPPYNMSKKQGLAWAFSKHVTMQEVWDIYGKDDFFRFNLDWVSEAYRILKAGGSLFVCGSFHNIYQLGFIIENMNFKKLNDIIWYKPNAQPNITCRMFTQSTEQLIWAAKDHKGWKFNYEKMKGFNNGKQLRNVWQIPLTPPSEKWAGKHPTQKPEALLERIILAASDEGDVVLDPFVGSGTTSVIAAKNGRNSIGIEINKTFADIALKRLNREKESTMQQKLMKQEGIEIELVEHIGSKIKNNVQMEFSI